MTQSEILHHIAWRTAHHSLRLLEEGWNRLMPNSCASISLSKSALVRLASINRRTLSANCLSCCSALNLRLYLPAGSGCRYCSSANLILRIAESIVAGYGYQNDVDEISPPRSPPVRIGDGQLSRAVRIRIGGIHYLYDKLIGSRRHIGIGSQTVLAGIMPVMVVTLQLVTVADALRIAISGQQTPE